MGDAENDHSLLAVSELGVAVGNAIPALKEHADLVFEERAGEAVVALLDGPVLRGEVTVHPQRWRAALGTFLDGSPAHLPASQVNVLVAGGSGRGKSFLAGLLVERLAALGYAVCVLDPEGDHEALGKLRGVASLGTQGEPPLPRELRERVRGRFSSVVAGLTALRGEALRHHVRQALVELSRERGESGLPHWIVVEEAQDVFLPGGEGDLDALLASRGAVLVSYQPERLPAAALGRLDAMLLLPGLEPGQRAPLARAFGLAPGDVDTASLSPGEALLVRRDPGGAQPFRLGPRSRPHVRHWHKYLHSPLPPDHWFFFRQAGALTGRSAANLEQFHRQLEHAELSVLRHHLLAADFSRWLRLSLRDGVLAERFAAIEAAAQGKGTVGEEERSRLLAAIEQRYGGAEEGAA